jgi:fatty acid desaturase
MERASDSNRWRIPNALNATIIVIQLGSVGCCFGLAARAELGWWMVPLAAVFAVIMNSVYSVIHEAEHAMLFSNRRVNDLAGVGMALLFPAPFHLIRQGHLGHHLRNRSDDEAFDLYFEGDSVVWRWMVWIGILTGFYYLTVVLANIVLVIAPGLLDRRGKRVEEQVSVDRPGRAFLESLNPAYHRWIRAESACVIALHVGVVWALGVPVWHYLAMYGAFGFSWSAMQYVHHHETERHVTRGARNLWFLAPIDWIWLHHNWHRTHHEHPTVPWVHLPTLARADGNTRRDFLLWRYLRMWRGPRKGTEHVENKYAGRIIQ